jgi:hypothetical protein
MLGRQELLSPLKLDKIKFAMAAKLQNIGSDPESAFLLFFTTKTLHMILLHAQSLGFLLR